MTTTTTDGAKELRHLVELVSHTPDWRVEDAEGEWHIYPPLSAEWWPVQKHAIATPSVLEAVGKKLRSLGWTKDAAEAAVTKSRIEKKQAERRATADYSVVEVPPDEKPEYTAKRIGDMTYLPPGPMGGEGGMFEDELYFVADVLVGPELAQAMLDLNVEYNRPMSESNVDKKLIAAIMRQEWILTNDAIGFDTNQRLYDGQKRLFAVVRSGVAVPFNLSYNNPIKAYEVVDTNQTRTGAQTLHSHQVPNASKMAAAARLVFLFDNARESWRFTMTNPLLRAHYDNIQYDLQDSFKAVQRLIVGNPRMRERALMIPAAATAAHFLCKRAFPDGPHESFVHGLASGTMLTSGDARWVLREFLRNPRNKRTAQFHVALYIKAWNDFVSGKQRNSITWRDDEKMPLPLTHSPTLL